MRNFKHRIRRIKNLPITLSILVFALFFLFPILTTGQDETQKTDSLIPPKAEKIRHELTVHNDTRIDNYYWLNQRDNPKVLAYLNAENDYMKAMMNHTEKLQAKLYDEIITRIPQDDASVPFKRNGYYYYNRLEKGKEYPLFCRKNEKLENKEEIMLDVNELAKGLSYCQVSGVPSVSPNNKMIAYGVDTVSRRKYTIHIKDLITGKTIADQIPNTTGDVAWGNDNKTIFYLSKDQVTLRSDKVMKHKLGTPVEKDKTVFFEKDETFDLNLHTSKSRKYIYINSSSTLSKEYLYLDTNTPDADFKVFQPREKNLEYYVSDYNGKFYILTNYDAKNFRLMEASPEKTAKENWKEVIPHRENVLLEGYELLKDFIVLEERQDGLTHLRYATWDQKDKPQTVDMGEEAYVISIDINPEFDTPWLRFRYESLTTPGSIYEMNLVTKEKKLLKQNFVGGGFDKNNYKTERLWATARDGVKVPISIVYKKGIEKNGDNPLLLYGYGAYGISSDPNFRSNLFSLLDRGFVYAIAHVRGGQEMGRLWYEDGKLLKKKNTFTDFIDCAEYLIAQKYTQSSKLFAYGGSAGGLLMGAIYNMRPDLFKGIIAGVPFVDIVTTMLDKTIPLTTFEYDEWGNPEEKVYYDYMLSYSPYDNVIAKDYPAMLVLTGLHDSQVQYFEPAKWVAKLRELKTDKNPLIMRVNMEAGHGGASGRFQRNKETALVYAFILDQLGINQ